MLPVSRRAASLGTENAFVVLAEVNALARAGKDIISFCIGQPDFPAPENVQDAAIRAIRSGKHGYTPSAGIDELREAAARYLGAMRGGLPIRAQDVVVGAGAKPFIAYAILSTTDYGAGDEVIYPNPGFPIYESQIAANGAQPVPIHLHEKRGFSFDPDELARLLNKRTKLLILNYPHNPTGGCLTKAELERIAAVLKDPSAGLGLRGRDLFAPRLRRRVLLDRPGARHVRAHDHLRRRFENLGDDGLAHRFHLESRPRAGLHTLDH